MDDTERGQGRETLPIRHDQPRPVACDVSHTWVGGHCVTAIQRDWATPEDAGRCGLCPRERCSARGRDHCLVTAPEYVPDASAPLFSLNGRTWAADRPGRLGGLSGGVDLDAADGPDLRAAWRAGVRRPAALRSDGR